MPYTVFRRPCPRPELQAVRISLRQRDILATLLLVFSAMAGTAAGPLADVERLISEGRPQDALAALEAISGRTAHWHLVASRVFDQLDQPVRAASEAEAAVNLDPGSEANHLQLGQVLLTNNNPDAARTIFADALNLFPESDLLRLGLGLALNRLQLYEEAEIRFRQVLMRRPNLGIALDGLVEACIQLVRYDQVAQAASDFLKVRPTDYRGYYYSGVAGDKTGRPPLAVENLLRKAIERNATFAPAHALLGKVLLQQNRPEEAALTLEGAVRLRPDYVFGHIHLARAYQSLGRTQDAKRHTMLVRELDEQRREPEPALRRRNPDP